MPDASIAARLVRLRKVLGFDQANDFAAELGISPQRWNHFETGGPLSRQVAFLLVEKWPWLTLDYLYFGRLGGLPYDWAQKLSEDVPEPPSRRKNGSSALARPR